MAVVERRGGSCWKADAAFVPCVVLRAGDERLVGQHKADRQAERFAGGAGLPKPVEVPHGRVDHFFVVDFVRALAAAGQPEAHPGGARRAGQGAVVDGARAARPVRTVVAYVAFGEAVQLVRPVEVHAAYLYRPVSGRAEGVGVGGNRRVE